METPLITSNAAPSATIAALITRNGFSVAKTENYGDGRMDIWLKISVGNCEEQLLFQCSIPGHPGCVILSWGLGHDQYDVAERLCAAAGFDTDEIDAMEVMSEACNDSGATFLARDTYAKILADERAQDAPKIAGKWLGNDVTYEQLEDAAQKLWAETYGDVKYIQHGKDYALWMRDDGSAYVSFDTTGRQVDGQGNTISQWLIKQTFENPVTDREDASEVADWQASIDDDKQSIIEGWIEEMKDALDPIE